MTRVSNPAIAINLTCLVELLLFCLPECCNPWPDGTVDGSEGATSGESTANGAGEGDITGGEGMIVVLKGFPARLTKNIEFTM